MNVRHPRGAVLLDGVSAPYTEFEVENNAFAEADKARILLPVSQLPADRGLDWLAGQPSFDVEVRAGLTDGGKFTAAQLPSIFFGKIDRFEYDLNGQAIILNARDLTASLIDSRTSERYTNSTASRVVTELAAKHGLTPVVTETRTRIGSYYQIDQVRQQSRRSEWDLLTWLAREEDFVVYVRGRELVFGPRPSAEQEPYLVEWRAPKAIGGPPSADQTRVKLEKALNLARDIRVTVRSWNHRQGVRHVKRAGPGGDSDPQYEYSIPGLTADQAQARAEQIYTELTQHAMRLRFDGPAGDDLSLADVIQVRGAGPFDQVFYPEAIRRWLNAREGYCWSVEAKNQSRGKS